MLWLLILLPAVAGLASYVIKSNKVRRLLWIGTALLHVGLSFYFSFGVRQVLAIEDWIGLDAVSQIFLPLTSLLFAASTLYALSSFKMHAAAGARDVGDEAQGITPSPEAVFTGCMLIFSACMSSVILSRRFGLQWVSVEATTLASTPLIYYHRNRRSLEAAWKYILLCSVGIAVALLGVFSLALAAAGITSSLAFDDIIAHSRELDPKWLKLAFIFVLVGYGSKMGMAPLHNWLPDAYSEAPSPVSALLSSALINCAFLSILRVLQVMYAADLSGFGRELLVFFGIFSMGIAGIFVIRQPDYKRMLAYSSVEHMGIVTVGVGLAGTGLFGSLLHAVNHSLVKAMLFMTAAIIVAVYGTKKVRDVRGIAKRMPVVGVLWLGGFLAITGSPPFGTFISEFTILKTAVDQGRFVTAGLYLTALALVFIGMAAAFLQMALGPKPEKVEKISIPLGTVAPPVMFGLAALVLGLYIPEEFSALLHRAAALIAGGVQ